MTEKQYGGAASFGFKDKGSSSQSSNMVFQAKEDKQSKEKKSNLEGLEDYIKAGEIAKKAKLYAKEIIKKDIPLLEIAEKIESKIKELGGSPAFPVNLSKNEIAAHATPSFNDEEKASGLLKVDLGVNINGYVADTALSLDLENSEENKRLIECAENCLKNALSVSSFSQELSKIGKAIDQTAKSSNLQPIINLSGHSITRYDLHAGVTIPNYDNSSTQILDEGVYAIEPFVTLGSGRVIDGKPSGIYIIEKMTNVRDPFAREVLAYIIESYNELPFCSRWLVKKFGTRALIALKRIEEAGILHHYHQLIEISRKKVAQAEHTVIILKDKNIITT